MREGQVAAIRLKMCYIKLPKEIMLKKAVVNMKSNGNACFAWAMVAAHACILQRSFRQNIAVSLFYSVECVWHRIPYDTAANIQVQKIKFFL